MICERCGATNAPGSRFCATCGLPLTSGDRSGGRPRGDGPPITGDLRWASVLFVDLVSYTSLTRHWDAADIRDMLSTYFATARTIADRYGGEVAKFIGDAVVAVWGYRATRENDAERCVAAGLEIVDAVARFGERAGLPGLRARGGVVTGRVALLGGAEEGLVAGDIVNAASRIQSAAVPGTVFVDDVTVRATRASLRYLPAGKHALKGLGEPIPLWQAVRGGDAAAPAEEFRPAFVGRAEPLEQLEVTLRTTHEQHRAQLVTVTGDAGVGKSRIVEELRHVAAQRHPALAWETGRCPSFGSGVAFHALSQMLRHGLGLRGDEPENRVRATLSERLPEWVPDPEERRFVEPRLAILLGPAERNFSRQELFAAWRLFFERLSEGHSVALVLEDLHWADQDLLDFLGYLLEWSAGRPLFLVAVHRTSGAHGLPDVPDAPGAPEDQLSVHAEALRVTLEPLPATAIERIVDDLVDDLPAAVRARIVEQAAGLPLYAIETVRSLVDRGLLAVREGRLSVAADIGRLDVPASLTALVAARLDQLPPARRELAKRLSLLGSSFDREAARALNPADDADLTDALDDLVARGILLADDSTPEQSGGRAEFRFAQSVVRAVAADLLSRRERKAVHLAVATYLEQSTGAATDVELVAAHYLDAFRAAGADPDRDDIRRRTGAAHERAADRVHSLGLPDRAATYYLQAAEFADDVERLPRLAAAARMHFRCGRYQESFDLLEDAVRAHREAGREVEAARLAPSYARALRMLGRSAEGLLALTEAVDVLTRRRDVRAQAEVHAALAEWYAFSLPEIEVERHVGQALALAAEIGATEVVCNALNGKGWLLQRQHKVAEAAATFERLVQVAADANLIGPQMLGLGNLADLRAQADLPGAGPGHLAALALAERLGDAGNVATGLSNLAFHYLYGGRFADAEHHAERAVAGAAVPELQTFGHFPLLILAVLRADAELVREHLAALAGWADDDDAQSRDSYLIGRAGLAALVAPAAEASAIAYEAARNSYANHGFMSESCRLAWPMAVEAAVRAGELVRAREVLAWVAEAPDGDVPPHLSAQLERGAALLAIAGGETGPRIEERLTSAIAQFTALDHRYWAARTRAELAHWLARDQRRGSEASALLAEARTVLRGLGVPDPT